LENRDYLIDGGVDHVQRRLSSPGAQWYSQKTDTSHDQEHGGDHNHKTLSDFHLVAISVPPVLEGGGTYF
jgi:hypothetical protein